MFSSMNGRTRREFNLQRPVRARRVFLTEAFRHSVSTLYTCDPNRSTQPSVSPAKTRAHAHPYETSVFDGLSIGTSHAGQLWYG